MIGVPWLLAQFSGGNAAVERLEALQEWVRRASDVLAAGGGLEQTLIRSIAARDQLGRTMEWDARMDAKIQALTPTQINEAFRRYLDPAQLSIVKAGDFRKAGVYQK